MELTIDLVQIIAEQAAKVAIQEYIKAKQSPEFLTKSAAARYLKCNRKTIDSMIERGQIIITPANTYTINHKIQ